MKERQRRALHKINGVLREACVSLQMSRSDYIRKASWMYLHLNLDTHASVHILPAAGSSQEAYNLSALAFAYFFTASHSSMLSDVKKSEGQGFMPRLVVSTKDEVRKEEGKALFYETLIAIAEFTSKTA